MEAVKNPYNVNIQTEESYNWKISSCTSVPTFNNPHHTVYKIKFNGTFAVVCLHV